MSVERNRPPNHPGRILKALYLEPRRVSVTAFAEATGLTRKHMSQIINGHVGITAETAERFARVLGTTAKYWLNLQNAVDMYEAKAAIDAGHGKPVHERAFATAIG